MLGQLVLQQGNRLIRKLDHTRLPKQTAFNINGLVPHYSVKVRLQTQNYGANILYKGPIHCAVRTVKEEGVRALFKVNEAHNYLAH